MSIVFPGFTTKALTFSYDDGVGQDARLAELFRRYGMAATFNLNSGAFGNTGMLEHYGFTIPFNRVCAHEVHDLYDGFEVASHTVQHLNLPDISDAEIRREVTEDCWTLEQLTGRPVTGLAYPCGRYAPHVDDVLRELGIRYARTIDSHYTFALPENFLEWHPTCHDHDDCIMELADAFLAEGEELRLFYVWGHAFELDKNDTDRWKDMEDFCAKTGGRADVWYATNGEICDYVQAMRQASVQDGVLTNRSYLPLYVRTADGDRIVYPGQTLAV